MKAYIVPIATYQAVAIAGGYGTGREVVQFFSSFGAYGGLFGLTLAAVLLAIVTAISFEFARLYRLYDYRSFVKELIGPLWVIFELLYLLLFLIVLAVVASAAGSIFSSRLGVPENVGLLTMLAMIASLLFFGRSVVERSMVVVTILLLGAFAYYFVSVLFVDSSIILERLNRAQAIGFSWVIPALQFAMYSATVAAVVLFSTRGIESRNDALASGTICGLLIMVPGLLFHISFLGRIDEIGGVEVPIYWMIDQTNTPLLMPIYLVAMFGTFIGTGLGFLQALNERLDVWSMSRRNRPLNRWAHVSVGIGGLVISAGLGQFGIVALIAKGYGTIAWGFLIVFIIPVLTIGLHKIIFAPSLEREIWES